MNLGDMPSKGSSWRGRRVIAERVLDGNCSARSFSPSRVSGYGLGGKGDPLFLVTPEEGSSSQRLKGTTRTYFTLFYKRPLFKKKKKAGYRNQLLVTGAAQSLVFHNRDVLRMHGQGVRTRIEGFTRWPFRTFPTLKSSVSMYNAVSFIRTYAKFRWYFICTCAYSNSTYAKIGVILYICLSVSISWHRWSFATGADIFLMPLSLKNGRLETKDKLYNKPLSPAKLQMIIASKRKSWVLWEF